MNLSMWSTYLYGLPLVEIPAKFAKHGFRRLELSDEHGRELLEMGGSPEKKGREFRKSAADSGVSFPQGHLWLAADIVSPDNADRSKTIDELKKWLELFSAIGVEAGVLHPGGSKAKAAGWNEKRICETRTESLIELTDFIADIPISIALENCYENINQMNAIIDAVDSEKLRHCLDTGHLNLIGGDQGEYIRRCGSKLIALHIADNLGVDDNHMLPHSAGTIDWSAVVSALRDIEYKGLFNFEVPGESRCPMEIRLAKLDYALRLGELMLA
ncbi:MAG: sugar phosphate isomerase/epimerase [Victivallales bacterium]|nr:sugar phosphate isomerase/epimerase [Victivallales bacterium]